MAEITKENVKAYEDVARHICHISESEPLMIFSIRGQRNKDCGRKCEGCINYTGCFPELPEPCVRQWDGLMNSLIVGGQRNEKGE